MSIPSTTLVVFQCRDKLEKFLGVSVLSSPKSENVLGVSVLSSPLLPHTHFKQIPTWNVEIYTSSMYNVTKFTWHIETSQNLTSCCSPPSFYATCSYAVTAATVHMQKPFGTVFSPIQSVLSSWRVWKTWEKRHKQVLLVRCATCCWQMPSKLLCATTGECTVVEIDTDSVNSHL